MRFWSLCPSLLDVKALVACWREGLGALKTLSDPEVGYQHHSGLIRWRQHPDPVIAFSNYLHTICDEADARGYSFARRKLPKRQELVRTRVTTGQIEIEFYWLTIKVAARSPQRLALLSRPLVGPAFFAVPGPVEDWERLVT